MWKLPQAVGKLALLPFSVGGHLFQVCPVTVSKQLSLFWIKAYINCHHPLLQVIGQTQ